MRTNCMMLRHALGVFMIVLVCAVASSASAQVNVPPGGHWVASIEPTNGRPCVYTPQWSEWQVTCVAKLTYVMERPGAGPLITVDVPVNWYRKFYGDTQFVFWQSNRTGQEVGTDGRRCLSGNPTLDRTWEQVLRAEVTYSGNVYVAQATYGGSAAQSYTCCPGQNCYPPNPPPCQ